MARPLPLLTPLLLAACSSASAQPQPSRPEGMPRGWDKPYTADIRAHTTAPEFLTSWVDHLPRSRTVPTPRDHLGYIPGTPDRLTYAKDVHAYMRALADKSRNVEVFSIGRTEEGREMIVVAIADARTLRQLDRHKAMGRELADPRQTSPERAQELFRRAKPMYWLTGGLHSPETGSPEMLMELAYRLAVDDAPAIREIRRNIITLITPVVEVDGRERMIDTIRWWQANPGSPLPPLVYWGHYVAHDNNRDAMSFSLALSKNILRTYMDYQPIVMHDLHESIPFLYVSTGTGPYNAWLDPVAIDTWRTMAQYEVSELTRRGMPGVWNHGFYDGWAPSYMFYIAHGHNGIGRFYETFGNSTPDTRERRIDDESERAWYRPNPPYPVVQWSLRNNVNYQQSGVLTALQWAARHSTELLETRDGLARRAVAKARTEGPAAYVIEGNRRRGQLRNLLELLALQGIEIHRSKAAVEIEDDWPPPSSKPSDKRDRKQNEARPSTTGSSGPTKPKRTGTVKIEPGDYIVRLDQPYSRLADMLLDTQYYRDDDSRPYDDTGWTLGYSKNVVVHRVVATAVLDHPMERVVAFEGPPRRPAQPNGGPLAVAAEADIDAYRYLWRLARPVDVLDAPATVGKRVLPPGTFIIERGDAAALDAADHLEVELLPLDQVPTGPRHSVTTPRVALLHTWVRTQDEGWYRLALEDLGIPYDYISTQDVAKDDSLDDRYDVILFPPCGCRPADVVWGLPDGPPIPWKKSDITPNLGLIDQTDDLRPGLGLAGVANLRRFVERGGTLITVEDTAEFAIEFGLARHVEVVAAPKLKAPGTLVRSEQAEPRSPVVYGYENSFPVYFNDGPLFRVGTFHPPDEPAGRVSGRGGADDPDVPQGRRFVATPADPEPAAHEQGWHPLSGDKHARRDVHVPAANDRPRIILRYADDLDALLLSGMLGDAKEMKGKAAVVDSPLGQGHVVLFGINPMWRQQTQGTFALVLNSMLHRDHLELGWPPAKSDKRVEREPAGKSAN